MRRVLSRAGPQCAANRQFHASRCPDILHRYMQIHIPGTR